MFGMHSLFRNEILFVSFGNDVTVNQLIAPNRIFRESCLMLPCFVQKYMLSIATLVMLLLGEPVLAQETQRMLLLASREVITLAPGETKTVDARCLDEDRRAPTNQTFFGTGADTSGATISKGDAAPITLRRSIELGQVTVSGAGNAQQDIGNHLELNISNNSESTVSFLISTNSVVVPEGIEDVGDLEALPYVMSENGQVNQDRLWRVKEWTDRGYFREIDDFNALEESFEDVARWLSSRWLRSGDQPPSENEWVVQPFRDGQKILYALHGGKYEDFEIFDIESFEDMIEMIGGSSLWLDEKAIVYVAGSLDQSSIDATALALSYGSVGYAVGRDFDLGFVESEEFIEAMLTNSFGNDGIGSVSGGGNDGGGDTPVAFEDDGWVNRTLSLVGRGFAKIGVNASRLRTWRPVLAGMETGVVEARNDPSFSVLTPDQAAELVEARIDQNLQLVKDRMGRTQFEDGTVRSEVSMDDALFNRFYVELFVGETRLVELVIED